MRSQLEDKYRYLTLYGDPVHHPLWKSFPQSVDFNTGGLATTFVTAVAYLHDPRYAVAAILGGVAGMAFSSWGYRNCVEDFYNTRYFGTKSNQLCIHTKPDTHTPLADPTYFLIATILKKTHAKDMAILFGASLPALLLPASYATYLALTSTASKPFFFAAASLFTSLCATLYGRLISASVRFSNVVNEKWVITDTPPPKRQEKRAVSLLGKAVPDIT